MSNIEEVEDANMTYHAIQFARWILKSAETHTTEEGFFTYKRPNGELADAGELYKQWIEERGKQPKLSELMKKAL